MLVGASFLCGDYTAKAVQPTNAKHLEVEHGRGVWRKPNTEESEAFAKWLASLLTISAFSCGCDMAKAIQRDEAKRNRAAFLKSVVRGDTSLLVRASFILFEIRFHKLDFYFKNYVTF